jgi:hypothetical protein
VSKHTVVAALVVSVAVFAHSQQSADSFTSNLPIIVLRADRPGPVSTSKTYTGFTMAIHEPKAKSPARLADPPTSTMRAGLRVRGMLSRQFPKLSYRLKFLDEKGAGLARPLLGMPADSEWVLHGPWLDKSLIRNAFSYDLARAMGTAGMRSRACEVFVSHAGPAFARCGLRGRVPGHRGHRTRRRAREARGAWTG